VDDEKILRDMLKYNLRCEGYKVFIASDRNEVVSLAYSERPDLVIRDIMLPGTGGFEMCHAINKQEGRSTERTDPPVRFRSRLRDFRLLQRSAKNVPFYHSVEEHTLCSSPCPWVHPRAFQNPSHNQSFFCGIRARLLVLCTLRNRMEPLSNLLCSFAWLEFDNTTAS
jgi:hypothetical protein